MKMMSGRQLQEFTNDLDRIAVSIGVLRQSGRLGNETTLSKEEKDELLLAQIKILRASAKFAALAVVENDHRLSDQLQDLKNATQTLDKTLSKLKSVQDVIDFSTLTLKVAEQVITGDVAGISSSLDKLLTRIRQVNHR